MILKYFNKGANTITQFITIIIMPYFLHNNESTNTESIA